MIDLTRKRSQKRAIQLKEFLLELDSVADMLYNRLEFQEVWDVIDKLETLRIKYYVEYFEHEKVVRIDKLKGRKNV